MPHTWLQVLPIIAVTALSACAPQNCDPSRTDLFTGVGCSAGGGYVARTQGLQSQYGAAANNAQGQTLAAREAQQEAEEAQRDLNQRQAELALLDRQTDALHARLIAARRDHSLSEARLQAAEGNLKELMHQRQATSASPTDSDLAVIKSRQKKVADIMSEM